MDVGRFAKLVVNETGRYGEDPIIHAVTPGDQIQLAAFNTRDGVALMFANGRSDNSRVGRLVIPTIAVVETYRDGDSLVPDRKIPIGMSSDLVAVLGISTVQEVLDKDLEPPSLSGYVNGVPRIGEAEPQLNAVTLYAFNDGAGMISTVRQRAQLVPANGASRGSSF